jgi:hypothetical protein
LTRGRTGQYVVRTLGPRRGSFLSPSAPRAGSIRRSRAGRTRLSYEGALGLVALGIMFVVAVVGYIALFART